ncbi:MAG: NUDIX domain-containing protein [Candidatus Eisenbacteria bacterium]|nr:NUDIX domain-containing protein [Candidatus Eisenbacteria bacterium]
MSALTPTHVEVYLFRRGPGGIELLLLRRSRRRALPGVWQPVTGRIRRRERALVAAAREVAEETGATPRRWWALESTALYFEPGTDRASVLPLFAAEIARGTRIRLSAEHDAGRFVTRRRARAMVLWELQRRALDALGREIFSKARLARELEITDLIPRRFRARPSPARVARR